MAGREKDRDERREETREKMIDREDSIFLSLKKNFLRVFFVLRFPLPRRSPF